MLSNNESVWFGRNEDGMAEAAPAPAELPPAGATEKEAGNDDDAVDDDDDVNDNEDADDVAVDRADDELEEDEAEDTEELVAVAMVSRWLLTATVWLEQFVPAFLPVQLKWLFVVSCNDENG